MFDRRVKIFLLLLLLLTSVLIARVAHLQVVQRGQWEEKAIQLMSTGELRETTRGRLLDRKGRELAIDAACIDACVDYRAIVKPADSTWVRQVALSRLSRPGSAYRSAERELRQRMLAEETARVVQDIESMWQVLADLGRMSPEEMEEVRQSIIRKVETRQRVVWYRKYEVAKKEVESREPPPWYTRWLLSESGQTPELDQYRVEVGEQTQAHVILPAVVNEVHNHLGKNQDRYPGLILRPSTHRYYPYREAAAHVIGTMAQVTRQDLDGDSHAGNDLRRYYQNDLIGRTGLEALCESLLRGTRGRIERLTGEGSRITEDIAPVAGADVQTTLDIELQRQVEQAFTQVQIVHKDSSNDPTKDWTDTEDMPGAAVIIDVPTGEVIASVSHPGYDANSYRELYSVLAADVINRRLVNRATQVALEPGSTVKPIVGIGAITSGIINVDDTIECTGYLVINGVKYQAGRCWVASSFLHVLGEEGVRHHRVPENARHATGFLTLEDALERSCNIYFETLADRMGMAGLRASFEQFGLGRQTGVGIAEFKGVIPGDLPLPRELRRSATWFSAIGQGQVLATPIQMANVAATIARDGTWARPQLVPTSANVPRPKTVTGPDRVDLRLSPAAVSMAKLGMTRAVNSLAGTGQSLKRSDVTAAGKTGTAQASPLKVKLDDAVRAAMKSDAAIKPDSAGRVELRLGTHADPNPLAPWYRGHGDNEDRRNHSWYIGFAPAENPKIAFAVMVEYGGSGNSAAGYVAKQMLEACIRHGYLPN